MNNLEMVREFHRAHDGGQPDFPLAARLIFEETDELREALKADEPDRVSVIKEMADVLYVLYGFADRFGIDLDEAYRRVHDSNMTKLVDGRTIIRDDGKILKPDTYRDPDLSDL